MHEMSIAVELVNQVVDIAREHNAVRVEEVEVEIGVMRQVVHEALEFAFSLVAEGTPAEGAHLHISEEKLLAVCQNCRCSFWPEINIFLCPQCGQANAQIIKGNEMMLKSVVCQTNEETTVT